MTLLEKGWKQLGPAPDLVQVLTAAAYRLLALNLAFNDLGVCDTGTWSLSPGTQQLFTWYIKILLVLEHTSFLQVCLELSW